MLMMSKDTLCICFGSSSMSSLANMLEKTELIKYRLRRTFANRLWISRTVEASCFENYLGRIIAMIVHNKPHDRLPSITSNHNPLFCAPFVALVISKNKKPYDDE